jgi:hypothetical protein
MQGLWGLQSLNPSASILTTLLTGGLLNILHSISDRLQSALCVLGCCCVYLALFVGFWQQSCTLSVETSVWIWA